MALNHPTEAAEQWPFLLIWRAE